MLVTASSARKRLLLLVMGDGPVLLHFDPFYGASFEEGQDISRRHSHSGVAQTITCIRIESRQVHGLSFFPTVLNQHAEIVWKGHASNLPSHAILVRPLSFSRMPG